MQKLLKQSTAVTIKIGPFVDATDGSTSETGLSISQADIRLSKNGGDIAQTHNNAGATHDENGYYDVPLDTTDTNTLGSLKVMISKAGALPVWEEYSVVPAKVYDSIISGTDNLEVDAIQWLGGTIPSPAITGEPVVTLASAQAAYTPAKAGDSMALTAAAVDAIWDEPVSGHATAASFGKYLDSDISANTDHISADYGSTEKAAIDLLDDAAGGLADIHTDLADVHTDVGTAITNIGDVHATDLPALKSVVDDLHNTDIPDIHTDIGTLLGYGNHPTAAAIADAVCDEVISTGHSTANSLAKIVYDNLNAPVGTVDTVVDGIATDVSAVHAHVGTIDGHITADYGATEKSAIDLLDDASGGLADIHTDVADIHTDLADVHTDVGTAITNIGDVHSTDLPALKTVVDDLHNTDIPDLHTDIATVDGVVDAIKLKTDNIPAAPALEGTLTTLHGHIDDILADTAEIQTELVDGGRTDLLIDGIAAKTVNLPASPAAVGSAMLITAGTGAGQLDVTSGVIKSNLAQILGTAITETVGGYLAAGLKKLLDVASPVFTLASINQTGDSYAKVDTEIGSLQTDVTAIRGKTDNLPASPAQEGTLTTLHSHIDDILADTAEIQGELADGGRTDLLIDGIAAKTVNLPASPAAVGSAMALSASAVDAIWDEPVSGHATAASFGKYLDSDISANTDHISADYGSTEKAAIDLLDDASGGLADVHTDVGTIINNIGTPIAIDSGTATVSGMLTKIADDNGGSSFDATTDSLRALQSSVSPGIPIAITASVNTETTGTLIGGTYASTYLDNGSYWTTAPVNPGGLDVYLTFALSTKYPNTVTINGRFEAATARYVHVYAYNFVSLAWEQLSDTSSRMSHSTSDLNYSYILLSEHKDPSTGNCRIRFYSTSTTTGDRLYIDQCLVNAVQASATADTIADAVYAKMKYAVYDGGIWIDTANGTDGTSVGVNGIPSSPVKTLADAVTLATLVGVRKYYIAPGSTIQLISSHVKWTFSGKSTIDINGQNITNSYFDECIIIGNCGSYDADFHDVTIDTVTNLIGSIHDSELKGAIGLGSGDVHFMKCVSRGPHPGYAPEFTLSAGTEYVSFRNYSGKCTLKSVISGQIVSVDSPAGALIIDSSCTGGEIRIRGVQHVTNGATGTAVTINGIDVATYENSIADAILKRDWTSVTGEASRSVLNALRFLRNKWSISGSTITITKEDDATEAWHGTVTSSQDADPIVGNDPS